MFTGIVEETGRLRMAERGSGSVHLVIEAALALEGTRSGDSISVDGVCQTVTRLEPGAFGVDCLAESLRKTTLGRRKTGDRVNLERALRADARLGGHIVQGHVSGIGRLREVRRSGDNLYLSLELPEDLRRYCVREGSIALDGISLTIAEITAAGITVNVIPATLAATTLPDRRVGDELNVETDIIGRYVERLLSAQQGMTVEKMKELGY